MRRLWWSWEATAKVSLAVVYAALISPVVGSDMTGSTKTLLVVMLVIAATDQLVTILEMRREYWEEVRNGYLRRG